MANLPNDPIMLMSVINTKLRDNYSDLDRLCDDMDISVSELSDKLKAVGYVYSPDKNQFVRG